MRKKERKVPGPVGESKSDIVADLPHACSDEAAAVEFMERQRWGEMWAACPRCGDTDVAQMRAKDGSRNARYLWRCHGCKQQFTVRVGTVMEASPIPIRHWCYAVWAACAGKKGVSAMQIQRQTGLSYKSALYMMHRIRHAMTPTGPGPKLTGIVEADETYVGGKVSNRSRTERRAMYAKGWRKMPQRNNNKVPVMALVQRGGDVRAMVVPTVTAANVQAVLLSHVDTSAQLMTDESGIYRKVGKPFASHEAVKHGLFEYVRGIAHINSAESFFSRLKRQIYGTHHAVSPKHLHRYVAEVAFKHNTRSLEDGERTVEAIRGMDGKRLRYKQPLQH